VDLDAAEQALAAREAEVAELERQAGLGPADPALLERLAQERDALADARDEAARARETSARGRRERAGTRDVAASARDRRNRLAHDDGDPGFPARFLSARDVDAAAGDRADALSDERHAGHDRDRSREGRHRASDDRAAATDAAREAASEAAGLHRALETRTVIGQAQGMLMARFGIGEAEAFQLLVGASQARNVKLRELARLVVQGEADLEMLS